MNTPDPNSLVAATKAAPSLDPQSAVAAAMVATSQQAAVGAATATAGIGQATNFAQQLQTLNPQMQSLIWGHASPGQQQQWRSVGYNPPAAPIQTNSTPSAAGGLIHDVMAGANAVGGALGHVAGDVLNAAASPLRAVQHLDRAGIVVQEMGDMRQGESQQAWGPRRNTTCHGAGLWRRPVAVGTDRKMRPTSHRGETRAQADQADVRGGSVSWS